MDPEVLCESKENIQPLSHGRITSQFGVALHAQSSAELQQELRKKIEQFELQLLSYDGDDELAVWVEYLSWIEQSFPKGGKEGNLRLVLEKCLTKFKDATWYMQDQRLVKLWVKYIDLYSENNPAEMYSMAHAHGVGTRSAIFYQFWAYEYEKYNDFKKADEIYILGIHHNAQPEDVLMQAHRNFQSAVARMTLYGTAPSPKRPEFPERQVMSTLQPHGSKNHVRNVRLGGSQPGVNRPLLPSVQANNARNSNLKILVDQGDENTLKPCNQRLHSLPRSQVINKENSLQPGPWTGPNPKRKERLPSVPASKPSTFQVHTDEAAETGSAGRVPFPAGHCTNALRPIKPDYRDFNVCYAVFEEPDPTKRPMYAKHKVYNGGREFSFEEIRALKYFKGEQERAEHLRLQSAKDESRMEVDTTLPSISNSENSSKNTSSPEQELQNELVVFCDNEDIERFNVKATQVTNKMSVMQSISDSGGETDADLNGTEVLINVQLELQRLSVTSGAAEKESISPWPVANEVPHSCSVNTKGVFLQGNASTTTSSEISRVHEVLDNKRGRYCHENSDIHARSHQTLKVVNQQFPTTFDVPAPEMVVSKTKSTVFASQHEGKSCPGELSSSIMLARQSSSVCTDEHSAHHVMSNDSCSSNEPSHLHSQSITFNTKEAMCVMNELWGSANVTPKTPQEIAAQPEVASQRQVDAPFTIFTDDDDDANDFASLPSQSSSSSESSKLQNPGKPPRPIFYIGEDDDGYQVPENKENVFVQELEIYEDEDIGQVVEIPAVPSPGMTEEEVLALEGTGAKENVPPTSHIPVEEVPRSMAGILQPSKNIPFEPLENEDENEPAPLGLACIPQPSQTIPIESAQRQDYEETEYSNTTCITQAFKFPLMSSTPFHSNVVPHTAQMDQSVSLPEYSNKDKNTFSEDAEQVRPVNRPDTASKGNLSIIMENSKEKSGSSSGSSNGGTIHRSMFYNTGWSSTRENMSEPRHRQAVSDFNKDSTYNTPTVNKNMYGHELVTDNVLHSKYSHYVETKEQASYVDSKENHKMCYKTQLSNEQGSFQIKQEGNRSTSKLCRNANQDQYNDLFTADIFNSPESKTTQQDLPSNKLGTAKESYYSEIQSKNLQIQYELSTKLHHPKAINKKNEMDVSKQTTSMLNYQWKNHSRDTMHEDNIKKLETMSIEGDKSHNEENLHQLTNLNNVSVLKEKSVDPFDVKFINELLYKIDFPTSYTLPNYYELQSNLPQLKLGSAVSLGNFKFIIEQQLGKGSYAQVLKVLDNGTAKALKVQKPRWLWEMYIVSEIHTRLRSSPQRPAFMEVEKCFMFENGSALLYEYCKFGTLLSVVNKMKTSWQQKNIEVLAMYWTIELLQIIEQLHSCKVIHGDLKPDNFLLRSLPSLEDEVPSLQLIDFGRGIDLSLLSPGITFNIPVKTDSFQCIEMKSGRPWTYQTDLYGLAATVHCILFGDYMKVSCTNGRWFINANVPRYFKKELWDSFFTQLLNVESCTRMPNLGSIRRNFEHELTVMRTKEAFLYFTNLMLQR